MSKNSRQSMIAFSVALRMLYKKSRSIAEISEETGLCTLTVRKFIKTLREQKLVVIEGWDVCSAGRSKVTLYTWRPFQKDAERKDKFSRCQKYQKTYQANALERWNIINPHMKAANYNQVVRYRKAIREGKVLEMMR